MQKSIKSKVRDYIDLQKSALGASLIVSKVSTSFLNAIPNPCAVLEGVERVRVEEVLLTKVYLLNMGRATWRVEATWASGRERMRWWYEGKKGGATG